MVLKDITNDPYWIYQIAEDFLQLDSVTRFNVGLGLGLVVPHEVLDIEAQVVDKRIFTLVFKKGLVAEFLKAIYIAKGGVLYEPH
jgi:mannitol/fructose-specific phosphotransferase system IIA component